MTTTLPSDRIDEAAHLLWSHWTKQTRIAALPSDCRPETREDGYAIQARVAAAAGQETIGWKIAATSAAGQKHIGVDGPLAGRLLAGRVVFDGTAVPLGDNIMRVAEAEFCFRMAAALPPRDVPYTVEETAAAVGALHPSIEVPDSRYEDFASVGAPQLIADTACASWLMIGPAFAESWRDVDLSAHAVEIHVNGAHAGSGSGKAVLGDPCIALAWLANEVARHAGGLKPGDYVTTGTCVVPAAISAGDAIMVDYDTFGRHTAALA